MVVGFGCLLQHSLKLMFAWVASCTDKDGIIQHLGVILFIELIVCHRILSTLKPENIFSLVKGSSVWRGYPQSFCGIASFCHSFIDGLTLGIGFTAFFQSYNLF